MKNVKPGDLAVFRCGRPVLKLSARARLAARISATRAIIRNVALCWHGYMTEYVVEEEPTFTACLLNLRDIGVLT